ncbi:hypothetical protein ACNUDM_23675 [Vibrio chaetopteri]|uniref:hypothetical protein n=1 Tax=Vibrio chaetopteri TaxID=3016528 RepID=UPI003AB32265
MMYHARKLALSTLIPLILTACGGSSSSNTSIPNTPDIDDCGNYYVLSSASLVSDGSANMDTYDLIESVLGVGSIEAPDLYGEDNHSGVRHITEDSDNQVGDYFRFTIHRDLDGDRDTGKTDRQRNEIKVYDKSNDSLKGFMDTIFEYRWKFRIDEDLRVTNHFTHLFQLKAVSDFGDPVSQPLVTITGNTKSGVSGLEVRHVDSQDAKTMLLHTSQLGIDWATQIQGQWLEVFVRAQFSEQGSLEMSVTPLGSEAPLFTVNEQNIELWRSGSNGSTVNFVRPKWGIYRSLNDKAGLNAGEDEVWFADLEVKEVQKIEP